MFLIAGCDEEQNDVEDPRTEGYYLWGDFILGESYCELYGLSSAPGAEFDSIRIIVYGDLPGLEALINGSSEDVEMQLSLLQEENSDVTGAPCSNILSYINSIDVFDGYLVPVNQGEWSLEIAWVNGEVRSISYILLDIEAARPYSKVIQHGLSYDKRVIAWREPELPVVGVQPFTVQIWRSSLGLLQFEPDTALSLDVAVQRTTNFEPSSNNENPVHGLMGLYSGEVNFPEPGGWTTLILDAESIPEDTLAAFQFNL